MSRTPENPIHFVEVRTVKSPVKGEVALRVLGVVELVRECLAAPTLHSNIIYDRENMAVRVEREVRRPPGFEK